MTGASYWGVKCKCGQFQALKQITSHAENLKPCVQTFRIICTHCPEGCVMPQEFGPKHLVIADLNTAIPGFNPHPDFLGAQPQ
jgi:hypothetical protein